MTKETYEKPSIILHVPGIWNKFGRVPKQRSASRIDGVSVESLIDEYGSPLFVFSEHMIRQKYRDTLRAFSIRYPKVQFAWSYKTNYLDAVCSIYHQEGSWAEVVSEAEYEMARRLGVSGDQIIFNGPCKSEKALHRAISEGAKIHLDNYDELCAVEKIAKEMRRSVPVAMRVNMDTGIYPRWDRFGFNFDNGEAFEVARRIHAGKQLKINGLHSHIGTFILEPDAYRQQTTKLAALAQMIERDCDMQIAYLDVGGGFASRNTLHEQYAPGADSSPSIDEYAEAVTHSLMTAGFDQSRMPRLILETGRALIDEAGSLITRVVANKRLANGVRSMIVDAGVNVLFTAFWYRLDVQPVKDNPGISEETVVYGPLCMNIDVVRPSVLLPPMEPGEALVVKPVGAYCVTQWMQFIHMRPPVVLIRPDGKVDVIREAETIEAIKGLERLPKHLQRGGQQ